METLPVVEQLDGLEKLHARLVPRVVVPVENQLILERAEEALDDCVVVAVAWRLMLAVRPCASSRDRYDRLVYWAP